MNYNYEDFLGNALSRLSVKYNIDIVVSSEQEFIELEKKPNTLYIVYKLIGGDNSTFFKTIPTQIFAMSEENSLEITKNLLSEFSELYNFYAEVSGDVFVKHSYNQPVVLSNFNEVQVGYRSVLYVSGVLNVMENIYSLSTTIDNVKSDNCIAINGEAIRVLSISFNYSMTPDSQAIQSYEISRSEKSISTLSIAFIIPITDKTFVKDCLKILNESKSGNTDFVVKFDYGPVNFKKTLKIISLQITDAPDKVGTIQIGMML